MILNPYVALRRLFMKKHPGLLPSKYNGLLERATEVGAPDVDQDPKEPSRELEEDFPF